MAEVIFCSEKGFRRTFHSWRGLEKSFESRPTLIRTFIVCVLYYTRKKYTHKRAIFTAYYNNMIDISSHYAQ